MEKYVRLVEAEKKVGADIRGAMKTAMLAILCSKDFYYVVEGDEEKDRQTLNDWELASRLSYLLWATMPDQELFDVARAGELHKPGVLKKQLKRMLADERSRKFTDLFPYQWLQLKKVGMFPPDRKLYPDYDDYLEKSMVRETQEFFAQVLEQNLSLREFIDSDWTMVNPRLALHYGVQGLKEDRFQKISFKPGDKRGGILTQASVLSLTSDGTRHRPVHRGVWVMESIFGKSPPPPPANVDPIETNPVDAPKASIRMKLEAHKHDPNCASCHKRIDPLGLAFDHFDAIGRWRDIEVVADGKGPDPKVDASGQLMDGRTFNGAAEFKQLLMEDMDAFTHTFVKKLATFALRRTMTVDDREDLDELVMKAKANDYRLRDLLEAFVTSDLFQKR